ncbi:Gustatory receptor 53 [Operophtera brumata]|uniref:Gustatory receptor n=1 Tax=Operophtera brumata TaxID=104452 RepID=A0A0L7LG91_OPEBR|nr:Gustatory receptor 53 [Operophtera brumata]
MIENIKFVVENELKAKKKNKIQENYYALSPLLILENFVGIFRFYLKNGQLIPPYWVMKLYSVILATSFLTAFGLLLRLPAAITGQESLIDFIDEVPSFFILFQYATTMLTTSFFLSSPNMDIIKKISELDDQLIKINEGDFYKKDRNRNIKYVLCLCFLQIAIVIIYMVTTKDFDPDSTILFTFYFTQRLEILVFCVLIGIVKRRLIIMNGYIAKFLEDNDSNMTCVFTVSDRTEALEEMNMIGRPSESNMKIRDLAIMYDKLGTICSLINNVYNFQIFMTLVSTFVCIVITIWTSLYYYKSPENNSGPLFNVSIWCFTTILVVAVMSFVCESLCVVRNRTKILVNQIIMDYGLPKTMRVQAKAFMELIEAWPLRIFIYDMFSVDITLMLKFISVATTYLIVIIQVSHFSN